LIAGLLLALLLPASADAFNAKIRRTAHGIPHIKAKSYQSLAYGYAYAFAQDNICPIADAYVTVRGERSLFFGPDGSYLQRGNGFRANNLNSDFFYKQIIDSKKVEQLLDQPPPLGPLPEVKKGVKGYVAGYNRYLKDVGGTNGVADPTCRGKPWVRPITEMDAYLRFYQLVLLASQSVAIDGIGGAQPPGPSAPIPTLPLPDKTARDLAERLPLREIGSNAVAVGRDGTRNKHGLLLGNPHFPWFDTERFYQSHLQIPNKKVDVQGASLFGVPLILIGNTRSMAWSHTVSTAYRFTPYQLTLVPGSPTTYVYDGRPEQMTSRTVSVQVKQADGSVKPQERTLYSTRFGPILTDLVGVPLPWTPTTAFAMRDVNADNFQIFNHFLEVNRAQSSRRVHDILKQYEGIPWVNTVAADRKGNALYADIGAIPHVTNEQAADCNSAVGAATFSLLGLPVLDGSRAECEWGTDPDAVRPGIFGPGNLPSMMRSDYVTNSNDSYWLSNPKQPLEGFDRIIGDERAARSLRTRIGLIMTQSRIDGSDGLGPPGFTRRDMQNLVFSNRQYGGELVRDELVDMCRSFNGTAPSSNGPVPTGRACDVLAAWDLKENADSRGAILFRRFFERALDATPSPWRTQFDPADPVNTPRDLNKENPQVQSALGDAIRDLEGAGIPIDAPLGDFQVATRNGERIPIHGGPGDPDGQFNAINVDWDAEKGVEEPEHGSSYVQVVSWRRGTTCPDARTILTYSQSTNPNSPFFSDQTKLFSQKKWVAVRFCKKAIVNGTRTITAVQDGKRTRTTKPRKRGRRR
jgi:acyl-homoserine-lactone acylase